MGYLSLRATRRNKTVFVWHSLGNIQAGWCLEHQVTVASPLAAHVERHTLVAWDALRLGDTEDRLLALDDEGCRCNGDMS